ncbi:MAG: MBL fold metallo-hydrolase [Candidatus Omnitrophica bacterium]|nr:MBL fold metallo-hydrolase [Candidatus Omnitrophota bacterium]
MNLTIHRGTQEIGGSCVELRTNNTRLLIDFGIPLVTPQKHSFDIKLLNHKSIEDLRKSKILPDIQGLYKNDQKGIDAILLSHSHLDHYGFLKYVNPDIPIYLSEGAKQLIDVSDIFIPFKAGGLNVTVMHKKRKLTIGDFVITPHLVDHSAFDALAFLIEADGKRVFYSGDFRGHGRKGVLFERMTEHPPEDIDCLIMEGSMLGRSKQRYENENEVQKRIEEILKVSDTITFLFASSQNIDRIVSAYKACRRTHSIFVIDIYTAFILDKLRTVSEHIPQFNWKNVRVKFLASHADAMVKHGYRDLLYTYNRRKIDMFEIDRKKDKILMLARDNSVFPSIIKKLTKPKGATIIYSMWEGYLSETFKKYCAEKGIAIEQVHTSGHAPLDDLQAFAHAIDPTVLIPIHTFHGDRFHDLFENVKTLEDDETFTI